MPEGEICVIAENLLEAMRFFGRARRHGEVRDHPGVCVVCCGLNYAAFNAAVLTGPLDGDAADLARRIQIAAAEFQSRNVRWTYWICDDYLSGANSRESRAAFQRFGLQPLTDAPGMLADRIRAPLRALPALDVRPVGDEETRNAFAWITSVAFDIPLAICTAVYGAERAWTGTFKGYVGYRKGSPVATTATVVAAGAVGVYSVATLPDFRRLGYGETVMRRALDEARQHSGVERSVLQSTRSGYRLYERMGYRQVTRFSVYIAE